MGRDEISRPIGVRVELTPQIDTVCEVKQFLRRRTRLSRKF